MYIRTAKAPYNKDTYVYLVEGYRDALGKSQQRVIKKYGKLSLLKTKLGEDVLEKLKVEAKNMTQEQFSTKAIAGINLDEKAVNSDGSVDTVENYGWIFLEKIYNDLGISDVIQKHCKASKFRYNLDDIMKFLVFRRVLNPSSKLQTYKDVNSMFGKWNIELHNIYRSLGELHKLKGDIQVKTNEVITKKYKREATFAFYDVTNYYFSSDKIDELLYDENNEITDYGLRYFGFSKEKRVKPIIQMGLFMDANGIPICYKLFRGNLPDVSTYAQIIDEFKEKYGFTKVTIVADKAMNCKKNIELNVKNGDGWIFSRKFRGQSSGITEEVSNFILDKRGYRWNKDKTFKTKSKVFNRLLLNGDTVPEKVVAVYSKAFAKRQQHELDKMIELTDHKLKYSQNELRRQSKLSRKYLIKEKQDKKTYYVLDEERIKDYKKWQGLNVITTSRTEMSPWEVIGKYHELWQIEESFKITKSDLRGRPVYVNKKEHIEGHFLVCFISLQILRILQLKFKNEISIKKLICSIKDSNCVKVANGFYKNIVTAKALELSNSFGLDLNKKYLKVEQLKGIRTSVIYSQH